MTQKAPGTDALFTPLRMPRGPEIANRFILAPLTNCQSHDDGTLSDDEYRWLTLRAQGGFGLVTTCASHVQARGQGFDGQMGCFSDDHLPGLTRLADGLRRGGAVSSVQLHHAGMRAVKGVADIVGPSEDAKTGARAMTGDEVEALIDDFAAAARRAERAGFDGVQIHGAHGYILAQFLSPGTNRREDRWGGGFEGRTRLLLAVVDAVRAGCGPDFQIGLRLSPERFGLVLPEMLELARMLLAGGQLDYLDISLWDVAKTPEDPAFAGQSLMSLFTGLDRGATRLGVAGKILSGPVAQDCLRAGADYVAIGRAAILAHDFPQRVRADATYAAPEGPVSPDHLRAEGLGQAFLDYLAWRFPGIVAA